MKDHRRIISLKQLENEYKYLNDLSITRTKDANTFWISSIVTIGGFLSVAIKFDSWVPLLLTFYIIPPFILGIIWQLDAVLRAPTYIAVIIDPKLHGGYTFFWDNHPLRLTTNAKYTQVIPMIYATIYIVISIFILLLSFSIFPYGLISFIAIYLPPIFILIISMIIMIISFSTKRTNSYVEGWLRLIKKCDFK